MTCENCNYFDVTDDKEWQGKPHCCFHEWGHRDDEIAPCDDPDFNDYVPSAENGDYSPSNPWDAPGMSIHDFI